MKIKRIIINICEACLEGSGSECHTPGCALLLHAVDLPIDTNLYEVLGEFNELENLPERNEESESEAYKIAATCLKPIEAVVESHKLQQVADKIVAALLESAQEHKKK